MTQHPSLLEAYNVALNLLPEVAWLGLSISDRHHQIKQAGTVVRDAASAAISAGQPEKAVEWLEQGRSIIWGQLLNLRNPVDSLEQKHPDLAKQLISLSTHLEGATTQDSNKFFANQAYEIAYARNLVLKRIRELEGFQQFLLPKTISEFSLAAQRGPLVFLNVSKDSCDALALLPGLPEDIMHVALPEFTPDHANNLVKSLGELTPFMGHGDVENLHGRRGSVERSHGQLEGGSVDMENDFAHILSELWMRLVKPVLNALAITVTLLVDS
jgi:hypothetical protein